MIIGDDDVMPPQARHGVQHWHRYNILTLYLSISRNLITATLALVKIESLFP